MERVFTESIRKADGSVKFPEGSIRSFPPTTWRELSRQIGQPLDKFTAHPEEWVQKQAQRKQSLGMEVVEPTPDASDPLKQRPRLRRKKEKLDG